jgi:16S rRNA (guanine966-N2)-methyltransferase
LMRVVGGRFRSRSLPARVPEGTRPTSDLLRETLFNILGPRVIESIFLDAYAGTGAVGIEALSRGAAWVGFIERSSRALSAVRTNLAALGIREGYRILNMDLSRALRECSVDSMRFDLVFLDPPYEREDLYRRDLAMLGERNLMRPGGWVVAEHSVRTRMPESVGTLRRSRTRSHAGSTLTILETANP